LGIDAPDAIMRAGGVGISLAAVGMIALVVAKLVMSNTAKVNVYLHGSARWANRDDIAGAGLLPRLRKWHEIVRGVETEASSGVYVGAWVDKAGRLHYLRHDGPEHVLTYAPTRSGKGAGLVVPTLLSWPASAVITDLKGELWSMTAGWRQKHARNKVLRFEPAEPTCDVFWNALDECRVDTGNEVGDVQNLATLIVDPDGKGLETHWQKTAQALLVGVILHALYKRKSEGTPASLPYIDHLLADPDRSVAELWMEMVTYEHVKGQPHPVVAAAARDMMDREATFGSGLRRSPAPVHVLPIRLVPLLHGKSLELGENDRDAHVASRQTTPRRCASEGRERFVVKVGDFKESRQGRLERVGDCFHHLERGIGFAVGEVGQEGHGDVRTISQFGLGHSLLVEQSQDVGEEDLVVHGGRSQVTLQPIQQLKNRFIAHLESR
jgi:hypothetical protein